MTPIRNQNHKFFVYIVGTAAALAGLLFGLDTGVISGAKLFIEKDWHTTNDQIELIVSIVLVGAFVGTVISGFVSRFLGRRFAILVSAAIFTIGSILSAISIDVTMLVIVRFFIGVGLGIATFTAPIYLSEVAPKQIRGSLIGLYQLMVTIGIFAAFLSNAILSYYTSWRWMLGVIAIPAFFMFIVIYFLPNSPRWLVLRGNKAAAKAVLDKVRHAHEVEAELEEIHTNAQQKQQSFLQLFKTKAFLKVLMLGMMLQLIQQFSGINAVFYYAPNIFKLAGFASAEGQLWATVITSVVNVLTTVLAIYYIDRFGRRPILLFGLIITTISMLALGCLFYHGIDTHAMRTFAVILVLLFIFGFAVSLGPIVWILCAEIFPLRGRDTGIAFSTATNWACNAIIAATFLNVLHSIGGANTMAIFGAIGFLSLVFAYFYTPETKGVSLEKIEENLMAGNKCRDLGEA